jgi:glycerol-3-phosphate acyltransferase PlsY
MKLFIFQLLLSYLIGSLSGALLLGRLRGVDIRTQGSGNAGGTNALRTQGWHFAAGVAGIDVLKGAIAALLGLWWTGGLDWKPETQGCACAFAAIVGHVWPVYFGFRGGKGVATAAGALLVLCPPALLLGLIVWALLLSLFGYVSLASVVAVAMVLPFAVLAGSGALVWFALGTLALIAFTHRANVQRLFDGKEHRFEQARVLGRLLGMS